VAAFLASKNQMPLGKTDLAASLLCQAKQATLTVVKLVGDCPTFGRNTLQPTLKDNWLLGFTEAEGTLTCSNQLTTGATISSHDSLFVKTGKPIPPFGNT
jgi:hypothetical protein